MKTVSLKIDDEIFSDTEKILETVGISRNRYINEALAYFNIAQKREILEEKLLKESKLVQIDSMKIMKEFEKIEYAD